mmetsp:Transcript_25742/g.60719  ORF Transcript_25742/g.60719 Transcript_25742/m.60719 type:complete len:338 (+) Transcript_25742:96-1109(+)
MRLDTSFRSPPAREMMPSSSLVTVTESSAMASSITDTATFNETSRMRLMCGKVRPSAISSSVIVFMHATAALYNMPSVISEAPLTDVASPMPGNTYMLLHCDGVYVDPLSSTGSKGLPVATTARPSVHSYACCGVHSAMLVGLLIGMTIGRSAKSAVRRTTCSVNTFGTAARPSRHVGLRCSTASSIDAPSEMVSFTHGTRSSDNPRLWFGSPCFPSALPMTPCEEHTMKRLMASSCVMPASTMPATICAHTPRPADPAPAHRKRMSRMSVPALRAADSTPASVTQPVPWMSSLKHRYLWRYFSSSGTAFGVAKSSNCTVTLGQRAYTACMNSSTMA